MPVTIRPASHLARKWGSSRVTSSSNLFEAACPKDSRTSKGLIQDSFSDGSLAQSHISGSKNGFVRALWHAYSGHRHLILRPEDVWFSILSQLNFFINAHAEELRAFFVEHQGKKELEVTEIGSIDSVDFGKLALRMTELLAKNVRDPDLVDWTIPSFSTTMHHDRVVAAILLMGAMQQYFSYKMTLFCGIPSVTLLGTRDDWEALLAKLDKLPQMGAEPAQFAALLGPVLRHFVRSFDTPEDPEIIDFWARVAHQTSHGSGSNYLSGWITAFCFWNDRGVCMYGTLGEDTRVSLRGAAGCELDGVRYHRVDTKKIPSGFASVPVTVDDNGRLLNTKMVAGSVAISASSSGQRLDAGRKGHETTETTEPGLDTLQPVSGWFMYKAEGKEEVEAREQEKKEIAKELEKLDAEKDGDATNKSERWLELWQRQQELTF